MLLTIDVGNTHSCFGLWRDDVLAHSWRLVTDHNRTEDEYAATLLNLFEQVDISAKEIKGAILSSVVPDTVFPIKKCCEHYFDCDLLNVKAESWDLGMKVLIDNPAELGADRLVNAFAARLDHNDALIIVDFGTATTFDAVSVEGDYIGGSIAPGVNLSLEALYQAAAKLHGISISKPEKVIGTSTTGAMQSGIYYGYLSMVNGIIEMMKAEYGKPMRVIATGGLASLYAKDNPLIDAVDEELTMRGLYHMYQRKL